MADRQDPAALLAAQLAALIGSDVVVTKTCERAWASINFSGTRYRFLLDRPCPWSGVELDDLAAQLEAQEFDLPGYFVADLLLGKAEDRKQQAQLLLDILLIIDPVVRGPVPQA